MRACWREFYNHTCSLLQAVSTSSRASSEEDCLKNRNHAALKLELSSLCCSQDRNPQSRSSFPSNTGIVDSVFPQSTSEVCRTGPRKSRAPTSCAKVELLELPLRSFAGCFKLRYPTYEVYAIGSGVSKLTWSNKIRSHEVTKPTHEGSHYADANRRHQNLRQTRQKAKDLRDPTF